METLDEVEAAPSRSGRLALVACLVLLVAVVGGVLVARSRATTPAPLADHSVTSTVAGDQLAVSLTVDDPDVAYGDTLTAHAVITNVSDAPVTVVTDPGFVMQLGWDSHPTKVDRDGRASVVEMVSAPYTSASMRAPGPTGTTTVTINEATRVPLEPGESVRIEAERLVDEGVRTGRVVVSITPEVVKVVDGQEQIGFGAEATASTGRNHRPLAVGRAHHARRCRGHPRRPAAGGLGCRARRQGRRGWCVRRHHPAERRRVEAVLWGHRWERRPRPRG